MYEMKKVIRDLETYLTHLETTKLEFNFLNRKFEHTPYDEPLTKFES